mmetsp:Transcript_92410/g.198100  ORF Transcript_92410/g.198100 Transcript_92410/m.198100 type:complete len:303 (+) Transcript_92410:67-975(+)
MKAYGSILPFVFAAFLNWAADALHVSSYGAGIRSRNITAERRKPVIWLHLHKSAGTLMCSLAKQQDEQIIQPEKTCNLEPPVIKVDGVGEMGLRQHRLSCQERKALYSSQGATWGQIEREYNLEDIDCKDSFLYGIMVRNPMSLMLSDLNFNHWDADNLTSWLQEGKANPDAVCGNRCEHTGWPTLGWQLFDNFAVRSLNGYEVWTKPPGHITSEDLEQAKRHLEKMDVVMVVEDLSQDKVQLEQVFGWSDIPLDAVNEHDHEANFTETQWTFLNELNAFDYALYEFGRGIAKQRDRQYSPS